MISQISFTDMSYLSMFVDDSASILWELLYLRLSFSRQMHAKYHDILLILLLGIYYCYIKSAHILILDFCKNDNTTSFSYGYNKCSPISFVSAHALFLHTMQSNIIFSHTLLRAKKGFHLFSPRDFIIISFHLFQLLERDYIFVAVMGRCAILSDSFKALDIRMFQERYKIMLLVN